MKALADCKEHHGALRHVRIPIRPHFGVIGLALCEANLVNSIPPGYQEGNIDGWPIGKGVMVYYPVAVAGGGISIHRP